MFLRNWKKIKYFCAIPEFTTYGIQIIEIKEIVYEKTKLIIRLFRYSLGSCKRNQKEAKAYNYWTLIVVWMFRHFQAVMIDSLMNLALGLYSTQAVLSDES